MVDRGKLLASLPKGLAVSQVELKRHFAELAKIGNLGLNLDDGFTRSAWSNEETAAMEYIRAAGQEYGLEVAYDGIGNLFLTTPGDAGMKIVQVGSHLDTVPRGGLFDGGVGVVAGLEAIRILHDYWPKLKRRLELVVWRGEESATFGAVCKGSQAAFGQNDPAILLKQFNGQTLADAILGQGYDPGLIAHRKPTLSRRRVDAVAAHIELHIEQAARLEASGNDIGVVTSIRGVVRLRVAVLGEAAHSGGTPMGVDYRKDANLAMAYMQVEIDRMAQAELSSGHDLVQTVGMLNSDRDLNLTDNRVYNNAMTKVSAYGYFTLDIRSSDQLFLDGYLERVKATICDVAIRHGVAVELQNIGALPAIESLDKGLQDIVELSCRERGYRYMRMSSGATHDLAVVSLQKHSDGSAIPTALIFIPCKGGVSHNPKEYASPEAVRKGAVVIADVLYKLAGDA